ncbi:hypothetical protein Pla110_33080 [Polystyrenella longa]|uniref:Uncharacterized protein n=1 Tax=Polystyrenella longa TaxID=2528007 RepID=A0A518CQR1_9PLAN|nr:hypothetical protein [Polystyrenella longa]QDU81566.1 hypothetical protein Pla110_33080 [Polystyrenella longa]
MRKKIKKVRKGDPITAELFNQLVDELNRVGNIMPAGGVSVVQTSFGVGISANPGTGGVNPIYIKNDDDIWEIDTWKEVQIWTGDLGEEEEEIDPETEEPTDPIEVYNRWGDLAADAWGMVFEEKQEDGSIKYSLVQGSCE